MRISKKGHVTVPQEIGTTRRNAAERVNAIKPARPTRGEAIVRRLRGTASVRMTTDQILSLTRK